MQNHQPKPFESPKRRTIGSRLDKRCARREWIKPGTNYCSCGDWLYPFVGQGVDVGNVIVSIVKIAENPNNKDNWFDLVFNLIAFVPVAGDGLKIVFKQLRSGKAMGQY